MDEAGGSNVNKLMILYDLTVQDEWRQEPETQVSQSLLL